MTSTVKKLLILGGTLTVATPVIFYGFAFSLGIYQFFIINHAITHGQKPDVQQLAASELAWVVPLSIFVMITGFIGFLFLAAGVIGYFLSLIHPKPKLNSD